MKNTVLKNILVLTLTAVGFMTFGCAPASQQTTPAQFDSSATPAVQALDELDPTDANIEEQLNQMDTQYIAETGQSPFVDAIVNNALSAANSCTRINCAVFAKVVKSEQKLYLYVNGVLQNTWATSTGLSNGHETPNLDSHPNGRIYDSYTSTKYPGGDYNGLGNMPYAVFISGGYAVHGTGKSNWSKLGSRASHGCVRIHPDNAFIFNRLVRKYGVNNVWIQITN